MSDDHPPPSRRRFVGPALLGAALIFSGSLLSLWWLLRNPSLPVEPPSHSTIDPTDPRVSYKGPYKNISPEVRYVGDAACVACHEELSKSYALHPMGRSLARAPTEPDLRLSAEFHNPFSALGRRFEVKRQGDHISHQQVKLDGAGTPVVRLEQDVQWVIGSGAKGRSYMTDREGYLFQTPISWFTQHQRWDLSPGFDTGVLAGRSVTGGCLFCHTNPVHEHPEHSDRFVSADGGRPTFDGHAIGCERCHGPGELHVRAHSTGEKTIVNPGRLSAHEREAVCEQCHLQGKARVQRAGRGLFDFRPGLPLSDFWAIFVEGQRSGHDSKAVNHVEQMHQSRCFKETAGRKKSLGCISCHDPHRVVELKDRAAHYRTRCLECHQKQGCSAPLAERQQTCPADDCTKCHMPRYQSGDIVHTASTDHRIPRRPSPRSVVPHRSEPGDFVDFYRDRHPAGDTQAERNLGMGLVKMLNSGLLDPQLHREQIRRILDSALVKTPEDVELRESKAMGLMTMRRSAEALLEVYPVLAKRPGNWHLLAQAADAAQSSGQTALALDYWRKAVEINPFVAEYQANLVALLIHAGKPEEAREPCRKLLQLDPFSLEGRHAWIVLLIDQGKHAEARTEFELIRRLAPADLAKRESWFEQRMLEKK